MTLPFHPSVSDLEARVPAAPSDLPEAPLTMPEQDLAPALRWPWLRQRAAAPRTAQP